MKIHLSYPHETPWDLGSKGIKVTANLILLVGLQEMKLFVSDPIVSCLLPPFLKLWRFANFQVWSNLGLFTVFDLELDTDA